MVYYSELIGRPVFDKEKKKIGKVSDFSFFDGSRYASISSVVLLVNKTKKIIAWNYVQEIKEKQNYATPASIYLNREIQKIRFSENKGKLLNEIMDKQLIDINGARVIRVNDILLGKVGKKLAIIGVDISTKGLMRRIGLDILFPKNTEHIILWKDVAPLSEDIQNLKLKVKRDRINELHPAEIADLIRDLSLEEKEMFFNTLSKEKAAKALLSSQPEIQKTVFRTLSLKKLALMLETLPTNEAAAILNMMPTVNNIKVLRLMKPGIAAKIKKILSYKERTAGSLMSTRFLAILEGLKVKKAISLIRKEMPHPRHIFYLYVKNKEGELVGVISLRDLLLAKQDAYVSEIVRKDVITVNIDTDIDDVFNLMSKYSLLAFPVVDKDKKIVGVIRVNDILEIMTPKRIKKRRLRHRANKITQKQDNGI